MAQGIRDGPDSHWRPAKERIHYKSQPVRHYLARHHDLILAEIVSWVEKLLKAGREGIRAVSRARAAGFRDPLSVQ